MHRAALLLLAGWTCATATVAQDRPDEAVFRDFTLVQRMRVVCANKHFGRVLDLVAEMPSGRITAAAVAMGAPAGPKAVVVPFHCLRYEAQSNLLQLGTCVADDDYPAFDPSRFRVGRQPAEDGGEGELAGSVLLSRLAGSLVQLQGGTTGSAQLLTVELQSGNLAFVDVAAIRGQAGDGERHPVPWSCLRFVADEASDRDKMPLLALPMTKERLGTAPTALEVILEDPLYRQRVYSVFGVPRPSFDRG